MMNYPPTRDMLNHVYIRFLVTYVSIGYMTSASTFKGAGTTANIENIFIGRCWEYMHLINPEAFADGRRSPDCTALWKTFHSAFAFKNPCDVTVEDYKPFVMEAAHFIQPDKTLFWSNVYPLVNEFSRAGKRYITIADTLMGYVVNNPRWCGQLDAPGIDYKQCPTREECARLHGITAEYAYWQLASQYFAKETNRVVHILLNGSHSLPYDVNSIFARHELIYLPGDDDVTELHVMVLHDIGGPVIESCGEGTILQLETHARGLGLRVSCESDPLSLRLYQCVDALDSAECSCVQTRYSPNRYDTLMNYMWITL